jgi:hypothetical protein
MPGSAWRRAAWAAGPVVSVALVIAGCGSAAAPPPAPSPAPATTVAAPPPTTETPTTSAAPPPLPVVTAADGTNVKACSDGTCEVAIDGPRTFRVLSFTATATPGPGSIALHLESDLVSQDSGTMTEPGPAGGVGANGQNTDYSFVGQDPQGRPVVRFTRD